MTPEEQRIEELFSLFSNGLTINNKQYNCLKKMIEEYDGVKKSFYREKLNGLVGKIKWE